MLRRISYIIHFLVLPPIAFFAKEEHGEIEKPIGEVLAIGKGLRDALGDLVEEDEEDLESTAEENEEEMQKDKPISNVPFSEGEEKIHKTLAL